MEAFSLLDMPKRVNPPMASVLQDSKFTTSSTPELLPWLVLNPMFHVVFDEGIQSRPVLKFQLERKLSV